MAGWHHRCNGHELGQTSGDGERQGGLACYSPWGCKESDTTGQLNNNNNNIFVLLSTTFVPNYSCLIPVNQQNWTAESLRVVSSFPGYYLMYGLEKSQSLGKNFLKKILNIQSRNPNFHYLISLRKCLPVWLQNLLTAQIVRLSTTSQPFVSETG